MEAADGAAVCAGAAIKAQQQPESKQEEDAGDHVAVDGVKVPPQSAPAAAPQPTPAAIKVQQPEPKQDEAPGDTGDDVKVPTHPAPAATTQRAPAAIKVQQPKPKQEAPGEMVVVAVDDVKVPPQPAPSAAPQPDLAAQTAKLAPVVENQKPLSQASPSPPPTPAAYQPAAMEEHLRDLDGHDVRVEGGWHTAAAVGGHGLAPAHLQVRTNAPCCLASFWLLLHRWMDKGRMNGVPCECDPFGAAGKNRAHASLAVDVQEPVLRLEEKPESQPSSSPALAAGAAATAYQRIPAVDDDEQLSPPATACHQVWIRSTTHGQCSVQMLILSLLVGCMVIIC
nr:translation initiation factor IF-2-like [Aegilops tauschii subsp. strangulata]